MAGLDRPSIILPSYKQGFARCAGESVYPKFWKRLVGAWLPFLGPTGLKLFDWSGFKNHGTLTSMDPATDWIVSGNGYALDFDGSDYINVSESGKIPVASLANPYTVVLIGVTSTTTDISDFIYSEGSTVSDTPIFSIVRTASNTYGIFLRDDAGTTIHSYQPGNTVIAVNERCDIAWTDFAGDAKLYVNGLLDTFDFSYTPASALSTNTVTLAALTRSSVALHWPGSLEGVLVFDTVLTAQEIHQLCTNPYEMWEPNYIYGKAPVAAGVNAPTGTIFGPLYGPLGGPV